MEHKRIALLCPNPGTRWGCIVNAMPWLCSSQVTGLVPTGRSWVESNSGLGGGWERKNSFPHLRLNPRPPSLQQVCTPITITWSILTINNQFKIKVSYTLKSCYNNAQKPNNNETFKTVQLKPHTVISTNIHIISAMSNSSSELYVAEYAQI